MAGLVGGSRVVTTKDDAETADQRLADFAGQVGHDLKNPLAAVRMSLELARDEHADTADPELLELLSRALRSTQRMDLLIGELVTYALVSEPPAPAEVDLAATLDHLLADPDEAAGPEQVVGTALPVVQGDDVQLRLLLQQLITNAVTYSPEGAPVAVTGENRGASWRVEVADRGPGVPAEDRERIFDPLVRLDRRIGGSGIGLATCRRIVEAHHGRIGVADNPGGGAIVWFELPR